VPSAVTIVDSSHTVPHLTQTASPELSFKSMSVLRHSGFEQRIWDILAVGDSTGAPACGFGRALGEKKADRALWRSEKQIPQCSAPL
jgi:hypothetical protein